MWRLFNVCHKLMFKNAIPMKDKKKKATFSVFPSMALLLFFFFLTFQEPSLKIIGRGRCDEDIFTY